MPALIDPISHINPTHTAAWNRLIDQAARAQQLSIADYFSHDEQRYQNFNFSTSHVQANLSRHFINESILADLLALAEDCELAAAINSLEQGLPVNFTEHRPALHCQLRTSSTQTKEEQLAADCRSKMQRICQQLHSQQWTGFSGQPITDIVSIGIGGSDLGPRMAAEALTPYHNSKVRVHFVTNIDPCDLEHTLAPLKPDNTLFIVISKSWGTLETLTNAKAAKRWLTDRSQQSDISKHFIAISARTDLCEDFGIDEDNILPMWDWVGGRFSLWSAAGLPIALATSYATFEALLAGAHDMDQHFFNTPHRHNLPVILALLEIWYVNFWGCSNVAVLPYDHTLRLLPNHLQQLTMESNGKSVDRQGRPLNYASAPVLWGSAGTIGQHSFHQLLHQGTQLIPVDFIVPLNSHSSNQAQHQHMVANCLAQAQTLMDGQSSEQVKKQLLEAGYSEHDAALLAQHKAMPANRPSSIISVDKLTPETLGALVALYEHKTYAASIIWNINAFDQWGVELGKTASTTIYTALQNACAGLENPATQAACQALTPPNIKPPTP
ncbi:glucose-6-phosphate isomerase [Dasania sp. GY-MA-18]|uniref:Glucose-6-phosphate isomerase n=1 Tax=Dasania phycosphaerae TaxID=2950436 RepID=A0A9J6RR77_9GAMM|nr:MULTISPECIES: glucose-6-phosphate isomerase [Dasania]MCR8924099.1 glucose-6-phosphate isomerase [Dasania sp. GY-MA-18]MCZ0866672.1 glucose-6-phosphate isomerase [Dasania phycosphaerae]MCZ0870257.1 glucose-6-phosphate isomerase [Dasania phycosphaerae]